MNSLEYTDKEKAYESGTVYLGSLESDIRKEAWELKDCCTRYAFQGITVLTAAYAILGRLIFENTDVGFVGAILAVLCLVLISLITYKYGSSNRVYGYLLHLQRSSPMKSNLTNEFSNKKHEGEYGWSSWMRFIGWEEALRAWRIVQPTIYYNIYTDPLDELRKTEVTAYEEASIIDRLKLRIKRYAKALYTVVTVQPWPALQARYSKLGEYRWFIPRVLVATDASFNSGNYLKRLCRILFFLLLVGYAFVFIAVFSRGLSSLGTWYDWTAVVTSLLLSGATMYYLSARLYKKTDRLESELESIHSCAVLWQITVVCHYRALRYSKLYFGSENYRYSFMVSVQALHLVEFGITRAHEWIDQQDERSFLVLLKKRAEEIANIEDKEKLLSELNQLDLFRESPGSQT